MDGVLNRDGDGWSRHIRALAPLFKSRTIELQRATMYAAARRHAAAWCHGVTPIDGVLPAAAADADAAPSAAAGGGPDLLAAVRGISMEVVLRWAYGLEPGAPPARELAAALTAYGRRVAALSQKPVAALCAYAALRRAGERITAATRRIIDDRAAGRAAAAGGGDDGISLMVAAGLPLHEIAAEVNHVHGAHKAASYVIAHALHDLGDAARGGAGANVSDVPGTWWADRLRAEVDRVLGADGVPSRDDLLARRLPLTAAVVTEATRRHVVSLGVVRRTGLPVSIDGVVIPAGSEVVLLLQALHHLPAFWLRPTEFRPERWLTRDALAAALAAEGTAAAREVELDGAVVGSAVAALSAGSRDAAGTSAHGVAADVVAAGAPVAAFTAGAAVAGRATALPRERHAEAAAVADGTVRPPPYAFLPFLTGGRMCSGKILAETEILVMLTAVLRTARVATRVTYCAHVTGEAVGTAPGAAAAAFLALHGFTADDGGAAAGTAIVSRTDANVVRHVGYAGPCAILLADNMYSTTDADVPFTARRVLDTT